MRILQVTPTYPPAWSYGGITKAVYEITKGLAKRGHDIEVWTSDALDLHSRVKSVDQSTVREEAKVRYFKNLNFTLTRVLNIHITPGMCTYADRKLKDFDILHLHGGRVFQNLAVYPYAKKYGIPYVFQAHGSLPIMMAKQKLKWAYDVFLGYRMLRDASKVIALSMMEALQYKRIGVPQRKIEIIPNGIELSKYASLPSKGSFRKKFSIGNDEKIVLYLGRIHKIKGIDILVKAFASVLKKRRDVKLVVAGPDDGYFGEFEYLIKALKIEDNVLTPGPLFGSNKLEAFLDADIFVLPSRYETFPMSVLEALACGTPVILSENCGVKEYFRDKVGLVVKPDSEDLSHGLLEFFSDERKQSIFRKNCKTVVAMFNISKTVLELEEVYQQIVDSARLSSH